MQCSHAFTHLAVLTATFAVALPAQDGLEQAVQTLERGVAAITKQTARTRAGVEAVRAECRRDDLAGNRPWRQAWSRQASLRQRLHHRFREVMHSFEMVATRVLRASADPEQRERDEQRIARTATSAVREWVRLGEPDEIAIDLCASHDQLARLLQLGRDPSTRCQLLTEIADRLVATPGISDLDILCSVVDWSAIFHGETRRKTERLRTVSTDLILVLTDRNAGGVFRAKAGYYKPGRFTSRGFAKEFRDDSDQVRHFAWAFHMFVHANNASATQMLLYMKERADSARRNRPINEADLRLNRVARAVMQQVRRADARTSAARYSEIIRRELGPSRN